ncbi:hypothetical protein PYW07_002618 [Mythimna separata]|uniref:unspecific monooxygenase n=1 Tax=Mythimna separata TaxID=271217 RepID=A0AAD7YGL2_MYTSE|nr:hypothetical protein PYW07_002618 [Mythimna separata]
MFGFKRSSVQLVVILAWLLRYYTFGSIVLWCIFACGLSVAVVLAITTFDHDYWSSRGVFSPPAWPIVGHILSVVMFKEQGGMCFKRIYDTYTEKRFLGCHQFYQRTLVVRDPELIKRMCVNDFQHFTDRGFFFNKDVDPLAGSVLFLRGNEWKRLRAKISPIFSPNKLRGMFPLIENTAAEFVTRVQDLLSQPKNLSNHNGTTKAESQSNQNGTTKAESQSNKNGTTKAESQSNQNGTTNTKDQSNQNGTSKSEAQSNQNGTTNTKEQSNQNGTSKSEAQSNQNGTSKSESQSNGITPGGVVVNSEKLVGGYTADAIVPCAFGLKSGVMYNEEDPFAVALHAFYEMSLYNIFEKTMRQFWPAFVLFFRMRIIPKKTHDFFYNIVTTVLRARENGVQEKRGDFIDMMMALRNDETNNNCKKDLEDVEITDMVISANAFIIFLGGFETTSSTLAFLFLELAVDQQVQERMRREIREVLERHDGKITYELLQELVYMEMVIQETLRLYPPFPSIQRMCTKDYTIPDSDVLLERGTIVLFPTLGIQRDEQVSSYCINSSAVPAVPEHPAHVHQRLHDPGQRRAAGARHHRAVPNAGHPERRTDYTIPDSDVLLERGTIVLFPTLGIQRDEQYFENASAFIPERWSDGAPQPPPGVYMPFGDGPRYCIGKRFALIQMKCCLVRVLQHIRISPARGGRSRTQPFAADPRSPLTLHPADSMVTLSLL